MNRKERRALLKQQHAYVADFSAELKPVPPEEFPKMDKLPAKAWLSSEFLVQLWIETNPDYPDMIRLSICRARYTGEWRNEDKIAWDELQRIKREVGYGDWYGIEVYPPDNKTVNVANFRHLWLLPRPLSIGWF